VNHINIVLGLYILENGKVVLDGEKGELNTRTVRLMMVIGSMGSLTDREN